MALLPLRLPDDLRAGDPRVLAAQAERMREQGRATRERVYEAVAFTPRTAAEIARCLGLTEAAVRIHLRAMLADERIERRPNRGGDGRIVRYAVTGATDDTIDTVLRALAVLPASVPRVVRMSRLDECLVRAAVAHLVAEGAVRVLSPGPEREGPRYALTGKRMARPRD